MLEKINIIKKSKHPYSDEINRTIALLNKIFTILLIALDLIGFIVAIIASTGLAEWASNYSDDVVDVMVNFFGYFIELESDTFGGSPFIVFVHTIIIFELISLVIFCVKTVIIAILNSKAKMLDSLYHNERLTELLVEYSSNLQDKVLDSQTN